MTLSEAKEYLRELDRCGIDRSWAKDWFSGNEPHCVYQWREEANKEDETCLMQL